MSASDKAIYNAIENAVYAAIQEVGIETVRNMSMFPSANRAVDKRAA